MVAKTKKVKDEAYVKGTRILAPKVYTVTYCGIACLVRATTPAQAVAKYKRQLDKPSFDVRLTTGEELYAAGQSGTAIMDNDVADVAAEPEPFGQAFVNSIEPQAELSDAA